jgi:hypothetical protein
MTRGLVNRHITHHLVFVLVSAEWVMMCPVNDNPSSREICAVIRFLRAKSMSTAEIHCELWAVYGQNVMSERTVRQWCRMFKDGRTNIHDEKWSSRLAVCSECCSCTKCWSKNLGKGRFTISEISCEFPQISRTILHKIIAVNLGWHKFCARCVTKMLMGAHKMQRMALAFTFLEWHQLVLRSRKRGSTLSLPHTPSWRSASLVKQMDNFSFYHKMENEFLNHIVTGDEAWVSFLNVEAKEQSKQLMHTHSPSKTPKKFKYTLSACQKADGSCFLGQKRSADGGINATRDHGNVRSVLWNNKNFHRAIQSRRGMLTSSVVFLHDIVRPHMNTAAHTWAALLEHLKWELFNHHPYSPDLTLSNYHLFTYLKNWLWSQLFNNNEELIGVKTWLSSQAAGFFNTGIQILFPNTTSASVSAVTALGSSLSMYVFFVYNKYFSSLLVLLTAYRRLVFK